MSESVKKLRFVRLIDNEVPKPMAKLKKQKKCNLAKIPKIAPKRPKQQKARGSKRKATEPPPPPEESLPNRFKPKPSDFPFNKW